MLNNNQPEWRYMLRSQIGTNRQIFRFFYLLKNGLTNNLVSVGSDIVIEGFPRSGNSHLYNLLMSRSRSDLQIASHLHVIAQLSQGLRLRKPVVVVVRKPLDCVLSLMMMQRNLRLKTGLRLYIRYYEYVVEISDGILILDFEVIKKQPHVALDKIREYGGFRIDCRKFDIHELEKLKNTMKDTNREQGSNNPFSYGLPSSEKIAEKKRLKNDLFAEINRQEALLTKAESFYRKLTSEHE